ncbi:hypothetical protein Y032_0286g1375 [Ancylostoma ceylanicum]|uniref:Uncharacterized protein n=1 Tax=Ancylostoma ceylanicum TaxID=53326 RepID=A0A016S6D7_9BILA|nr:hypothetical protein Y032_0286g1375 [Ancylostoma ceylanicum]
MLYRTPNGRRQGRDRRAVFLRVSAQQALCLLQQTTRVSAPRFRPLFLTRLIGRIGSDGLYSSVVTFETGYNHLQVSSAALSRRTLVATFA